MENKILMNYKTALERDVGSLVRLLQNETVFEQFLFDNCIEVSEPRSTDGEREDSKMKINEDQEIALHLPSAEELNPISKNSSKDTKVTTDDSTSSKIKSTKASLTTHTNYHKYFSKLNRKIILSGMMFNILNYF